MKPPLIRKGARIAVVATCGVHDPARLQRGIDMIRSAGHTIEPWPDLQSPWRYLASSDDVRLSQILSALADPAVDAVWIARGGYGLTRLLAKIEDAIVAGKVKPKPILGFSDVTALYCLMHKHSHGPLVHGPVVHSLPVTEPGSVEHLMSLLSGEPPEPMHGEAWAPGTASGPLIGGNLSLLAALCGTRWQLSARGAILLVEEIGEAPYRVDRLLQQIADAGVLDGVAGVAFGEFEGCKPPEGASYTLEDVLREKVASLGVPVIGNLPVGHGARNRAFVWGSPASIRHDRLEFASIEGSTHV